MMRLFIGIAVLVGFAMPCSATSYRMLLLPELVGRADVIVIGTITKVGEAAYHVKVTATLAGKARNEVTFRKWADTKCKVDESQIFFLVTRKGGPSLIYPFAHEAPARADEVRRLVDMKTNPKKYLDDPKYAVAPNFLEILGYAFADRDKVGRLTETEAVEHLQRSLMSDNKNAVLQAIAALQRTGSKESAMSIIPLIRHPDEKVRLAGVKFLDWSFDKRAVEPLCKALDAIEKDKKLGGAIGRALGHLRDPAAAPALERAVKRGIDGWTSWALGTVGSESSFEILLDRAEKHDSMDALGGLRVLVYRSNKKPEPWMDENSWSEATGLKNKDKWRKWWDANKSDFKVIKTADEAFRPHKQTEK
ncbi:MAG TPA: hypothetical protein VH575_07570 [Gemmataceae bacterium]|jgi:hypothetical protein